MGARIMETWRRFTLLFIGFFESVLFSGIIFGWASLLFILQEEEVYSHLCKKDVSHHGDMFAWRADVNNATPEVYDHTDSPLEGIDRMTAEDIAVRCDLQSNTFTLIYTVAVAMHGMASVLVGFSLDRYGLWATRLFGSLMLVTGFFCLAFTSKDLPWLLWPAMNLVALGSNQLKLSSFQFTNLWPKRRSTILFIYGSGYSISATVFTLLQHLYTSGISYQVLTLSLATVSLLTIPATFLMPPFKVTACHSTANVNDDSSGEANQQAKELLPMGLSSVGKEKEAMVPGRVEESRAVPLMHSLLTLSAALHFFWLFTSLFLILFYAISFNSWMYKATDDSDQVGKYTKIMGVCQLIGPLITPISGVFTDWRVKVAKRYGDPIETRRITLQAPAFACAITTCLLVILMTCKMFVSQSAIYASMFIIAISRPMTHSSHASYVRLRFPEEHFNRLNGIFFTVVSVVMFVQYPIFFWMFSSNSSYYIVNWLLIAFLFLSLLSPAHLLSKRISRMYAIRHMEATGHVDA